jgi:hypothetical protein
MEKLNSSFPTSNTSITQFHSLTKTFPTALFQPLSPPSEVLPLTYLYFPVPSVSGWIMYLVNLRFTDKRGLKVSVLLLIVLGRF